MIWIHEILHIISWIRTIIQAKCDDGLEEWALLCSEKCDILRKMCYSLKFAEENFRKMWHFSQIQQLQEGLCPSWEGLCVKLVKSNEQFQQSPHNLTANNECFMDPKNGPIVGSIKYWLGPEMEAFDAFRKCCIIWTKASHPIVGCRASWSLLRLFRKMCFAFNELRKEFMEQAHKAHEFMNSSWIRTIIKPRMEQLKTAAEGL